jgi:tape measure domain-containing protein
MSIRVELELDDGSFTTRILHAAEGVDQFNRNVGQGYRSIARLQETSQGFLGTLRDVTVVLGMARAAFENVRAVTTGWAGDIIKVNADVERMQVLLKGMSTAANPVAEAAEQVKFLRDFAKQAPFSLQALSDTFVKMKSTGIDPMKGALQSLVDGIAAFGGGEETLKRATIAIQQMSGKGVIQMEELRQQLGEAIPRAVELMARSMGVTMGELIKKIATGTVDAKHALQAFQLELSRTYGGAAFEMMQTFNGLVSQSKTLLQNLALDVGNAGFFNAVKSQLKDLNAFMAGPTASNFASQLGGALGSVVNGLRDALEWMIKFRSELLLVGQILVGAFAAKMAIAGLTSLTGVIGGVITQARLLSIAWGLMNTQMNSMPIGGFIASMARTGPVLGAVATALRSVGAAAQFAGAAMTFVGGVVVPLAGAVIATAAAFGLFSNKAKDAYERLKEFGAQSKKQVLEAQGQVTQLETALQRAIAQREQRLRHADPRSRARFTEEMFGIPELRQKLLEARGQIAKGFQDASKRETETAIRSRSEQIDMEIAELRKGYDKEFIERSNAHKNEMVQLANEKKSTQEQVNGFQKWGRDRALKYYDDQLTILETYIHGAKVSRDLAAANEIEDEVKRQEAVLAVLTGKQREIMEARAAQSAMPLGVVQITAGQDIEKLLEKGRQKLSEMKGEAAGVKAELSGASNEMAKMMAVLESGKYGPADDPRVQALIAEFKAVRGQIDANTEALEKNRRIKNKLDSARDGKEGVEADLESREADLQRRLDEATSFKFSNSYHRSLKEITRLNALADEALQRGVANFSKADRDQMVADNASRLQRERDLEINNAIQTEQEKIKVMRRGLMTENQAREDAFQEEVRRLQSLLTLSSLNGDQRAQIEGIVQQKIQAFRAQTEANSPAGRQMREWRDLGAQIERSYTGWLDQASDQLADFVATGKMDFASLRDAVMKDLARMAIRGAFSNMMGGMGGKGGGNPALAGAQMVVGGNGKMPVPTFHTGGRAGFGFRPTTNVSPLAFLNAAKFHGGGFPGLKSGEIPAVVKKGEEVGWPSELAEKYGGTGGVAMKNEFNVNVSGGGGSPAQNQDLAEKITKGLNSMVEAKVAGALRQQMRPGGMLNNK